MISPVTEFTTISGPYGDGTQLSKLLTPFDNSCDGCDTLDLYLKYYLVSLEIDEILVARDAVANRLVPGYERRVADRFG